MRDRFTAALIRCQGVFATYAQNHFDKIGTKIMAGTPEADETMEKGRNNQALVSWIEDELRAPDAEVEHATMVWTLQKPGEAILEQMTPLMAATVHMAGAAQSEAGELFDAVKRWAFFGKFLDRDNVVEELGDIEFYLEGLRQNLAITREETLVANLNKLVAGKKPRYPGGVFSDAATIARADKQPGDIDYTEPTARDPLGQGLDAADLHGGPIGGGMGA